MNFSVRAEGINQPKLPTDTHQFCTCGCVGGASGHRFPCSQWLKHWRGELPSSNSQRRDVFRFCFCYFVFLFQFGTCTSDSLATLSCLEGVHNPECTIIAVSHSKFHRYSSASTLICFPLPSSTTSTVVEASDQGGPKVP